MTLRKHWGYRTLRPQDTSAWPDRGKIFKKVKERIAVNGYSHLTATGRHLPYGITQCYLPPDTSERVPP